MASRKFPTLPLTIFFTWIALVLWDGGKTSAQVLNLRGGIEVNYGQTTVDTDAGQTRSPSFLHRYNLGTFGALWDPRLGSYDADFSYQEDLGKTDGVRTRDTDTLDYRVGFNLLPRKTPLTFFAQRITRDNELEPSISRNRLDTYSLTWDLPLRRLPHLRMNLFRTDSKLTPKPTGATTGITNTQSASIDASHSFATTSVFTRYQYSEQKSGSASKSRSHIANFNSETRINPTLTLNAHGNYSNRAATLGVVTPQTSTFQQRSAGASLIHRPSLALNNRVSYDFVKDPFDRHIFLANSNYRATEKLDLSGSYRFLRFVLQSAFTNSHFGSFGVHYRPLLGLSTGLNLSYNLTDVNAQTDSAVFSQNYAYFINYYKRFDVIAFNTGYNSNYIRTAAEPGEVSNDLINTVSFGISNANPRYASLSANYNFTNTYRTQTGGEDTSFDQHGVSASAQSSYLRNLILRGDLLSLNATGSYTVFEIDGGSEDSAMTNETVSYDTLRGVILTGGHSYENASTAASERNVVFGQFQLTAFLMRNLHFTGSVRESLEIYTRRDNIALFESRANILYQLGRISISLEGLFTAQDETNNDFTSHSFFIRASRPLF